MNKNTTRKHIKYTGLTITLLTISEVRYLRLKLRGDFFQRIDNVVFKAVTQFSNYLTVRHIAEACIVNYFGSHVVFTSQIYQFRILWGKRTIPQNLTS